MKKNQWLVLIVVVLVAVLGYWLMGRGENPASNFFTSPTASPTSSPAAKASGSGVSGSPVAPLKSYTELVEEYEGRRIQFDATCQAIPKSITYKNGTSIMLDNRSGDARIIKVGDRTFNLQGYGYWITTLSSSSLPQELLINCGAATNVGTILLQAQLY